MRRWLLIAIVLLLAAPRVAWAQDEDTDPDRPVFTHVTRVVEVVKRSGGRESEPLGGITVEAWGVPGGPLVRRTGQDGTARFEDMPRDDVVFVARAPGHACGWHHPGRWWWSTPEEDADTNGDGETRVRLVLEKGTTVEGRVLTTEDGEPVRDAEIVAYEVAEAIDMWTLVGAPLWRARTDGEGLFRTGESWSAWTSREDGAAPLISAWVTARAPGRIHERMEIECVDAGSQEPLTFELPPATEIRGVVRDADGDTVPDVIVSAYPSDHWAFTADRRQSRDTRNTHPREMSVQTGPDGEFVLGEAVPATTYFVIAEAREHREEPWPDEIPVARSRVVEVTSPTRDAEGRTPVAVELVLARLGSLAVRVAPDAGGSAGNLRIDVTPPADARPWASDDEEDGVLRVDEADAGTWTVSADAMGWLAREMEVVVLPGEERSVEMRLERGAVIEGIVRDDAGEPIVDANVYAYPTDPANPGRDVGGREETHTDGQGRFTLSGLPVGPTEVFIAHGDLRSDGPSPVNAPAEGVELLLSADAVLRLRLRLPHDAALPESVRVTITHHSGALAGRQSQEMVKRTDDVFEIRHVRPGTATVAVEAPGFAPAARRVDVRPGVVNDLTPLPLNAGVTLRGRVVDGGGAPVAKALVLPWGNEERAARTADDGTFELPHLAPGLVELAVSSSGMAERFVTVGVTELRPPVEITLTPGALVRGTVTSRAGGNAYVASLDFVPAGADDGTTSRWRVPVEDGAFEIRLPPGRYDCDWVARAETPDEPLALEVAEGEEVELALVRN